MIVEATYELPYLAHVTMEPMNATAHVAGNRAEVWAPTQYPGMAIRAIADTTALPGDGIDLHITRMGGGFGRRIAVDYVGEATAISREVGAPVQGVWSREDDVRHDHYRPASLHRMTGGLDAAGLPIAFNHRLVQQMWSGYDPLAGSRLPYSMPTWAVESISGESPVQPGYWRAVGYTNTVFATEHFLDELARAGGQDPVELRRTMLTSNDRLLAVLNLVAEKAAWGTAHPDGWTSGVALCQYDQTYVALVAQVSVADTGGVRVQRVVCAIDCGIVVNPATVEAQIEGAVAWGVAAALKGEITFSSGAPDQSNFDDYPILRMDEMPVVETHIVASAVAPSGVGEPMVPVVAPAIANAVLAATGQPVRRLPMRAA
jgi:isoquinoline 1-oxidoreductase beta subunit